MHLQQCWHCHRGLASAAFKMLFSGVRKMSAHTSCRFRR